MKKTPLNFLSRKNQSLFDTNVKMRELETVEFQPASSVISDSGTASVRARPTVKHFASSDNFQGFAVPTPKVPVLPPSNGPMSNGSVGGNHLYKGSVMSVPDLLEGDIFVPPHPSVAPPPPPGKFFLPPPDFLGDLNSSELANFQAISVPTPKPMSLAQSEVNEDLSFLKPPSMAPPKVPIAAYNSPPPISPTQTTVPQCPSYAPPLPPADRQFKTEKLPPPKPIRFSSGSSLDLPPQTPAPPPPVKTPALSTFNPQNPAKLYNAPKISGFGVYENRKPKQMFLMEDSGTLSPLPNVIPPSKPAPRDLQDLKGALQSPQPSKTTIPELKETTTGPVEISKSLNPSHKSPQLLKVNGTIPSLESTKNKYEASQDQNLKFSPLLDRKLRNIKSETSGPREGSATSPLALLMAAKEREKHRSIGSSTQEDNTIKNGQLTASVHLRGSSRNSLDKPRSTSYSSLPPDEVRLQDTPKQTLTNHTRPVLTPSKYSSPPVKSQIPSAFPTVSQTAGTPKPARNLLESKKNVHASPPMSHPAEHAGNTDAVSVPFLPPPPEFGDFADLTEPPSIIPSDPLMKKAPSPTAKLNRQPPAPPPPLPKAVPPPPPKVPPPNLDLKSKPKFQTTPKPAPSQLPTPLSPSQVTLLSILQKKMLEMDHKISPMKEAESNSDEWGSPLSDEDSNTSAVPKAKPQIKSFPVANKAATLNMKELENKLVRKAPEKSSVKASSPSNGAQHQYGMTFTVRPGTRNPITIVSRGDP